MLMAPVVLAISGRMGSGKSTIADLASTVLMAPCASFGSYIRKIAEDRHKDPMSRRDLQEIGKELISDPNDFCAEVLQFARYQPNQSLVVDGVRHLAILDVLRNQTANSRLVHIHVDADPGVIESRLKMEGETRRAINKFEKDETEAEVKLDLPTVADVRFLNNNNFNRDELSSKIMDFINKPEPRVPTFAAFSVGQTGRVDPIPIDVSLARTKALKGLTHNWDGYGAVVPGAKTILHAVNWLTEFNKDLATVNCPWIEPNVTASGDGEIVFEWWNQSKKLTAYISQTSVDYVKVWGPNMLEQMDDGILNSVEESKLIWRWLIHE